MVVFIPCYNLHSDNLDGNHQKFHICAFALKNFRVKIIWIGMNQIKNRY